MKVRFEGDKEMVRRLRALERKFGDAMGAGLYREGEKIMTESKRKFVPVDEGVLRSTGKVQRPKRQGKTVTVTLSYGGPAAPYALKQHEDTTLSHPGQGQAKYLEIPMREAEKGMAGRLARAVGAEL